MKYISTVQTAEKWGISDRRVRTLCREGKISGSVLIGKSYKIPEDAKKPSDGRTGALTDAFLLLKWNNDTIGIIDEKYNVKFIQPQYNDVVKLYTAGRNEWSHEDFVSFLSERTVGRDRRDIEKILFRCGLSTYDVLKISEVTRGIHPKDLIWISKSESEKLEDVITQVFESVFLQKIDLTGDSVDTPEGYNIKRYGVLNGKYGIYKQRISPLVTDVESEVAVYKLGRLFGVDCCPAYKIDDKSCFSEFLYDFSKEYIVHFRRLFVGARGENEYENLVKIRPGMKNDIIKMLLLDFITRQDDRHLSNIAIMVNSAGEHFYPLYDNGRSLFYEDTEETVFKACSDIEGYCTNFGFSGTYLDHLKDIAKSGVDFSKLINLDVSESEIKQILTDSDFRGYRLDGALKWILGSVDILKKLSM